MTILSILEAGAFCFGCSIGILSLWAYTNLVCATFVFLIVGAVCCVTGYFKRSVWHGIAGGIFCAGGCVRKRRAVGLFAAAGTGTVYLNTRSATEVILIVGTVHYVAL